MELITNKNINDLLNIPCVKNEKIVFKAKIEFIDFDNFTSKISSHYEHCKKAEKYDVDDRNFLYARRLMNLY
jgi:hypothetical protein